MRAYIDTNILVDLVLARQEFLPDAQRVFALGYAGEAVLMVSALSFIRTSLTCSTADGKTMRMPPSTALLLIWTNYPIENSWR